MSTSTQKHVAIRVNDLLCLLHLSRSTTKPLASPSRNRSPRAVARPLAHFPPRNALSARPLALLPPSLPYRLRSHVLRLRGGPRHQLLDVLRLRSRLLDVLHLPLGRDRRLLLDVLDVLRLRGLLLAHWLVGADILLGIGQEVLLPPDRTTVWRKELSGSHHLALLLRLLLITLLLLLLLALLLLPCGLGAFAAHLVCRCAWGFVWIRCTRVERP